MFVFAFAFVCSVEVVLGQTNRQSHGWITSADGQWHCCEITSMGTHYPLKLKSYASHARVTYSREGEGMVCCKL